MLTLEAVHAGYGRVEVLHGVALDVRPGEVTALVGANGAGKTTTLRAIAGLIPVGAGRIVFESREITAARTTERVAAGIALAPEGRLVFPTMSVEENLTLGAIVPSARRTAPGRRDEMYALFPRLAERRRQAAGSLSGGEQQMLAIARALMSRPRLLLLDEPTLGLAPLTASLVFETVERLRASGVTILMAEQDVRRTLRTADRAFVLEHGRVVLSGSGRALLEDPAVRAAYLGA